MGFEVEPFSVKHQYAGDVDPHTNLPTSLKTCTARKEVTHDLPPQQVSKADEVLFTYDVRWEYSDVKWASRWDVYLYATDDHIHWFSSSPLSPSYQPSPPPLLLLSGTRRTSRSTGSPSSTRS